MKPILFAAALTFAPLAAGAQTAPQTPARAAPLPLPAEVEALKLPEGELVGIAAGNGSATFLDPALTRKAATGVEATLLMVFEPPVQVGGKLLRYNMDRIRFDCGEKRMTLLAARGFDEAGAGQIWLPAGAPEPIELRSRYDFVSQVVCGAAQPPQDIRVTGHREAAALTARMTPPAPAPPPS